MALENSKLETKLAAAEREYFGDVKEGNSGKRITVLFNEISFE